MHLIFHREMDGKAFATGGENMFQHTGSLSSNGEMALGLIQVIEAFLNLPIMLIARQPGMNRLTRHLKPSRHLHNHE